MAECAKALHRPSEQLMQAWIYKASWSIEEAIILASGLSPDAKNTAEVLDQGKDFSSRAIRSGKKMGTPREWLWWGEINAMPFHSDWWLAITPEGPIGFDGQHFAFQRAEMLSEKYLQHERFLIGKWARKPYWTAREAIDLSLNFDPFTSNGWRGDAPEKGATIRERDDRFLILKRALEIGEISEKSTPIEYLNWLETRGYYVSRAWRKAVSMNVRDAEIADTERIAALEIENEILLQRLEEANGKVAELEQGLAQNEPMNAGQAVEVAKLRKKIAELSSDPESASAKGALAKRISCLEKALLCAAVDGHSYDPRQMKSDVPAQIADKSQQLGCSLTAQTVRKYLKECADYHVDGDVWSAIYP